MTQLRSTLLISVAIAISAMSAPALAKGKPTPTPTPTPTPPPNPNQDEWNLIHLTQTDAASANGGAGVVVALMDGLTDCRHQDLAGRCSSTTMSNGIYRFYDDHGTHTAGIVAGKQFGVATGATIRNYAVFDDRKYVATGNQLINAWRDAWNNGARISSMSFGCTGQALCFTAGEVGAMADVARPMLFVKAAGNDGTTLANESVAISPAAASTAIARLILVGSVDIHGVISSFSNTPGTGCLIASGTTGCASNLLWQNHFIVAPGESIYSTLPGNAYGNMSGTSMATPVVAGAAALLQARWPALKQAPETLAEILFSTADDKGAVGTDPVYGRGLLNVARAFQANGVVTLQSSGGSTTSLSGATITSGQSMTRLAAALAPVTVYDRFGRDFALAETGALRFGHAFLATRQLLGRRMLGFGSQENWASTLFAADPVPGGFSMFGSPGDVPGVGARFDDSMRMGLDMPIKGGASAQLRLTGSGDAQMDFAYDPTLRPLGFFASSGLMKNALLANALVPVGDNARLMIYGTTTAGSVKARRSMDPLALRVTDEGYTPQLSLKSERLEQHQSSIGVGYWKRAGDNTIFGINASFMTQTGGYYDLSSDLAAFEKPTRMFNLGAAMSHEMGSWELIASGELTHLRMSDLVDGLRFTPASLVSGEIGLRRSGIAFSRGMHDSLGLSLVQPPHAISGNLQVDYMTRTADGLGRTPARRLVPLSQLGQQPLRLEAAYRISSGKGWRVELSGGANLGQADYVGAGEAMASYKLTF